MRHWPLKVIYDGLCLVTLLLQVTTMLPTVVTPLSGRSPHESEAL